MRSLTDYPKNQNIKIGISKLRCRPLAIIPHDGGKRTTAKNILIMNGKIYFLLVS